MNKFRIYCEDNKIPIISQNTENFLTKKISDYKFKSILEIWSAICYSTIFFASEISKYNGNIMSFELSLPSYKQWLLNISKFGSDNILLYNMDFGAINHNKIFVWQQFDLIFVDARKSRYLEFFKIIQKNNLLSKWWRLIFDDVIKFDQKTESLIGYLNEKKLKYKIFPLDDDDWILIMEN